MDVWFRVIMLAYVLQCCRLCMCVILVDLLHADEQHEDCGFCTLLALSLASRAHSF